MLRFLNQLLPSSWRFDSERAQSLRRQEELEFLYDKAPIGMCLVDRELRFLRINQWLADINGVPREAHLGNTLGEILPDLVDVIGPYYEQVLRTGQALIDVEVNGTTAASDESRCWLVSYHPLLADDGSVAAVSSIVQDVTMRTRNQKNLENANHRIHDILESITDGFISFDTQWKCRYVNRTASTLFRMSVDQILGKSAWEIFPESQESKVREKLQQARHTNLPVKFEGYYPRFGALLECRCYPSDEGVSVFIVDNTQTRNTLQRLRKSESALRRLAAVVEKCNDFVGICKPDCEPIYINQAGREMVGLAPDADLAGTHFLQYFAPEDHAEITNVGIPAIKKTGRWKGAVRFKNVVTGADTPSQWNVFAIRDPDGELPEVWATISPDLSEQRRMEDVLRSSEQRALQASVAKSEFLANMSHEIRTPMAAILGYADLLLSHLQDSDDRGCVMIMKKNGEQLLDLINDILDLSRIEAGKLEVDLQECELPQLLSDIESLMQVRANEKQLEFRVRVEGSIPRYGLMDAKRVRQVLINLLGNAIKFTERGHVELAVRYLTHLQSPTVEFDVVDTGIGMTSQQQARLFQPFTQGDSSVTRAYGGSGLGLAISQRLVEMLHGKLVMQSEQGKGTKFSVQIPIGDPRDITVQTLEQQRETPATQPILLHRKLACHVLIADDRRDVRFISQYFLEASGATITAVEDGRLALAAAETASRAGKPFDIIVLDMQMPHLDGYQAATELRKLGIEQPIIALTADAMKGDRERCLLAGCDDYVSKPIQQALFVEMIGTYTQDYTLPELRERRREQLATLQRSS